METSPDNRIGFGADAGEGRRVWGGMEDGRGRDRIVMMGAEREGRREWRRRRGWEQR